MSTHDLRTQEWGFVPQADPDGVTSIIQVNGWPCVHEGDFVIVSSRYRVVKVEVLRDGPPLLLHCTHAPRTMAEIEAEAEAAADRNREQPRQPKPVPIPKWVHPDFHSTYQIVAMRNGEESAAKAARAFKPASSPEALQEAM